MAGKTIRRSVAQDLRVAVFAGPTALLEAPGEGAARLFVAPGCLVVHQNHRKTIGKQESGGFMENLLDFMELPAGKLTVCY